jgi:putative transposase
VAIRNRLYPGPEQQEILRGHCAHARLVWNLAVEQQSWRRPGRGPAPSSAERYRQLAQARTAVPWLGAGSSSVQQQALRDFDKALAAYLDPANPACKPGYRSSRGVQGLAVRETRVRRVSRRWGVVFVPKCGGVKFRWTRPLPAKLGTARVTCDRAGRWHVSFPAAQPAVARQSTGKMVGVDRGVRTALVTSDSQHYRAPQISARRAARYLALQRRLARQRGGSRRRERTRAAMALIAVRTADRRRDWAEKVSTRLVRENDVIVLEKLNITGITRKPKPNPDPDQPGAFLPNRARAKARLSRGILASAWGVFGERVRDKGEASVVRVVFVDPRFTSQQCHACGHTNKANRDSQAVFTCVSCGHKDHADRNAALNILARGLPLAVREPVPAPAAGHAAYARVSLRKQQREPSNRRRELPWESLPPGQGGCQGPWFGH